MAYSLETSSVKTIVPGAEVSGFCDVVARQKINEVSGEVPQLSAGEGIDISTVDGKTVITNNISAGSNMSLVYDQETNTIRLDAEGGTGGIDWTTGDGLSAIVQTSSDDSMGFTNMFGVFPSGYRGLITSSYRANSYSNYFTVVDDESIFGKHFEGNDTNYYFSNYYLGNFGLTLSAGSISTTRKEFNTYRFNDQGLSYNSIVSATWGPTTSNTTTWTWNDIKYIQDNSASLGKTYSGISPIVVNNTTNQISADTWSFSAGNGLVFTDDNANKVTKLEVEGETLSAGPGINIFASGGYVVISAGNDDYNFFPMTGTNGTTGFTANMDCSSMMLTTGASPAGGYVKQTVRGIQYEAYPATDVSASWYNIINGANNRSNCYCIRFTNDLTSVSLEDYSAYDKVTVVHSNQYTPNCELYWNGNTKVFPSGLYCELVKGTNDQNQTDWFFTTSGWINNIEWDYD